MFQEYSQEAQSQSPTPARRRALLVATQGDPVYAASLHSELSNNPASVFSNSVYNSFGGVIVNNATLIHHTIGVGPAPPQALSPGHYVSYDWTNPAFFTSFIVGPTTAPYSPSSFVIYLTMRWENSTVVDAEAIGQGWLDAWTYSLGEATPSPLLACVR